jgi:hypothetical protein
MLVLFLFGPVIPMYMHGRQGRTQRAYQLETTILIVGRDANFGCVGCPRQLHDWLANALLGAQQRTAYTSWLTPARRAGGASPTCGPLFSICAVPLASSA